MPAGISTEKWQLHHAYNRLYDRSQLFLASPIQAKEAPQAANKEDHLEDNLEDNKGGNLESNQGDKQRDDQRDGQGDVQRDDQEKKLRRLLPVR